MDQDTMVTTKFDAGWHLARALYGHNLDVVAAFWAKLSGEQRWLLYIASPVVDEKGAGFAYRLLHAVLRDAPEWGLDPFDVMVVGVENPMAQAAMELAKPKSASASSTIANVRVIPFNGFALGGIGVEGAYIYAPSNPALPLGVGQLMSG